MDCSGFVWGSEWSQFAPCYGIGDGEGVPSQHIGVLMAKGREPCFVLGTDAVTFGAEFIEHRVHINGVPWVNHIDPAQPRQDEKTVLDGQGKQIKVVTTNQG